MTVHVIHENLEWTQPLFDELAKTETPYVDMDMSDWSVDLMASAPAGIFYNRMSASSHTRGHRYAPEMTSALLSWLEASDATVLNGSHALRLELNKAVQYGALQQAGLSVPDTIVCQSAEDILAAFDKLSPLPVITKHNRAGKGLGVKLFHDRPALEAYVHGAEFDPSVDGLTLVQRYIEAPKPQITRLEFIGREFLYAVKVDTSGGFELCPADVCALDVSVCPADSLAPEQATEQASNSTDIPAKFQIDPDFAGTSLGAHLIPRLINVMNQQKLDVAAFEFITDAEGNPFVYDINTNTNYNAEAEALVGISAMERLAAYLVKLAEDKQARHAA